MLVGFGSTYYYVCMLHTWKVGNACTRFRNAPWILWIQGAALPPLRMWRSLSLRYPPRPSAGPLYLPHPPPPPSLPSLPSNSKELVPPWFKVCCWSLIKGRPIPPFSFQPSVPYVLLLGQLLLARAGTLKHQPKEVRQPAAAWAVTAMQPGSRRQSASSFSNLTQWTVDLNLVF